MSLDRVTARLSPCCKLDWWGGLFLSSPYGVCLSSDKVHLVMAWVVEM